MADWLIDGKVVPGNERTAKIFLEIGNSVSDFIKLTADYPSQHDSAWLDAFAGHPGKNEEQPGWTQVLQVESFKPNLDAGKFSHANKDQEELIGTGGNH